jgi:hypothetical protein
MYRAVAFRFHLLLTLILLALLSPASAQEAVSPPKVDINSLTEHVYYLASDELEGRQAGTPGCNAAAEYIAGYFDSVGLLPFAKSYDEFATYFQQFRIASNITLGTENHLSISSPDGVYEASVSTDFLPFGFSSNGTADAAVVFVGYGITAPEYDWDDYADLDVTDKIVFCLRGEPGQNETDSPFRGDQPTLYSSLRWKALNTKAHGAIGLIAVTGPANLAEGEEDKLIGLEQKRTLADIGIPVIQVTQDIASKLWSTMDAPLAMYQAEMDRHMMPFGAELAGISVFVTVDLAKDYATTSNVIGCLPGNDSGHPDEWVIIGAHYDHLGWGIEGSRNQSGQREIHNGADDNASGTAGVMELARMFAASERPARSILFICFSAEEIGTLGSEYYAESPIVPLDKTSAMINMDMIGRVSTVDGDLLCTMQGEESAGEWPEILPERTPDGAVALKSMPNPIGGSDFTSFYMRDIPVLNFFSGAHEDYHRPSDDADRINYEGMASVVAAVYEIALDVADWPTKLTFVRAETGPRQVSDDEGNAPTYTVYLGTIPDFMHTDGGFWIQGVIQGSPAEAAGLLAGDQILKFGDYDITDIYTYTDALGHFQPGDEVRITIIRNGEELVLTAILASREDQ